MSGIIGIFDRNGAPVDRDLLDSMTAFLAFRGPDAQKTWADGATGFGHALLKTTWESDREQQPCTLDGEVWITADARMDARAELIGKLESAGRRNVGQATDPELILHAYHVWGEQSLDHLLGDFAFVIWDRPRRQLFGARDQLGVKPFYYVEAGQTLLCSNTLNGLRLHPGVSGRLNDLAIADFLLFEGNQDLATTYFSEIRRLPAAHFLVCTREALRVQRYWTLPEQEIRYRRGSDYVERFRELFGAAVKDRLRTDRVTVSMSGGMDSTLVAAFAHKNLSKPSAGIRALTAVFDRIIPDQERKYSRSAADFIGIPIEHFPMDDSDPYVDHAEWSFSTAEPDSNPMSACAYDLYRRASECGRVLLTGYGGDPLLATDEAYIVEYFRIQSFGELLRGIGWCARLSRRIPRVGIRSLLRKRMQGKRAFWRPYPEWLNRDFEKRLELKERKQQIDEAAVSPPSGTSRSRSIAQQSLYGPFFPTVSEAMDAAKLRFPIESRHPFFDLRLAAFLTGLPALPWCQEKNLFKAAGIGLLPDEVRLRAKAPLAGDPISARCRLYDSDWWATRLQPAPELAEYIDLSALPRITSESAAQLWANLRLVNLNCWLQLGRKRPSTVAAARLT